MNERQPTTHNPQPTTNNNHWNSLLAGDLASRREINQFRQRQIIKRLDSTHVEIGGRRYVNFASNDYLGLSRHPRVIAAATETLQQEGVGSAAAALVCGYSHHHASAERAIARWKGTEAAVLTPSGYQANLAAVQTLAALGRKSAGGVRFLMDKLVHASLVDAVRGTGLPYRTFPHNGLDKLQRLLQTAEPSQLQVVVTESIFSMDGDAADLAGLARIKQKYPFVLLLDEAHASGVYGQYGSGYAAERGLQSMIDVTIVTLSKALGCVGGAVCASRNFCDALVNHGRAYIYSTNLPPAMASAAEAAIGVLHDEPHRRHRVRELAKYARSQLAADFPIPAGDSPIIPIVLGSEQAALAAAERLKEAGLLAPAIRPPTVPRGASRIRVTLSSDHSDAEIDLLLNSIRNLH